MRPGQAPWCWLKTSRMVRHVWNRGLGGPFVSGDVKLRWAFSWVSRAWHRQTEGEAAEAACSDLEGPQPAATVTRLAARGFPDPREPWGQEGGQGPGAGVLNQLLLRHPQGLGFSICSRNRGLLKTLLSHVPEGSKAGESEQEQETHLQLVGEQRWPGQQQTVGVAITL